MPKRSRSGMRGRTSSKRSKKGYKPRKTMGSKVMLQMARSAVLKAAETKYVGQSGEDIQLYHNGGAAPQYAFVTNLLITSAGTSQGQRVGDEVYPVGLSINIWLSNKSDRPNVMYRVFIVAVPNDQYTAGNPTGLFKGVNGNKMIDYIDTDKYNIRYHKIIQPSSGDYSLESGAANKEHSKLLKIWLPIKGKIQYASDGGTIAKLQKHLLSLCIIPYDAKGSLVTDNIASFAFVTRFYFKDP